jgi:hypothetical protein
MTDPWTDAFDDLDLLPGLTGPELGGARVLGVDPFDMDFDFGGGGPVADQPSSAGDQAGIRPPEGVDAPPSPSSEVTGDNTVVVPFPREAFYVGGATAEPGVDDLVVQFGDGAGTDETTVDPPEIASAVQLDLSEATFSSADDEFGAEVVGEGMVVEVRDHRHEDPILPAGPVGDGEPVVRDHRASPLDDILDGPF